MDIGNAARRKSLLAGENYSDNEKDNKCVLCCVKSISNCLFFSCCCCFCMRCFSSRDGHDPRVEPQTYWQPQELQPQHSDQPKPSAPDASEFCNISISEQFGEGFIVHETSSGVYVLPEDFFKDNKPAATTQLEFANYALDRF